MEMKRRVVNLCTGAVWVGLVAYLFGIDWLGVTLAFLCFLAGLTGVLPVAIAAVAAGWYFLGLDGGYATFAALTGLIGLGMTAAKLQLEAAE